MKRSRHLRVFGLTLLEVMVSAGVLAITTIAMTQSMLILNRNSSLARVRNLAKAMVLSRIQEVGAEAYNPTANPAVIPSNLAVTGSGGTVTNVNLGDASTELGPVPATMTWTVTNTGKLSILSVDCLVSYTFLGRKEKYEIVIYRAPD